MASIPFSLEPMRFVDESTEVTYLLAQPTDAVEIALEEFAAGYEQDIKKRLAAFQEKPALFREWINGHVDIILQGWESDVVKLPAMTSAPSAQLRHDLKLSILQYWRKQTTFTKDDLVK
jgi:hypothetical protein